MRCVAADRRIYDQADRPDDMAALVRLARQITTWRRKRDTWFAAAVFSDPQWDILLDLFATAGEGRSVSMSSLCIAAAVPTTTAMRCINAMVDQGLLVRTRDAEDGRRMLVELTENTRAAMCGWLQQVAQDMRSG